jgi:hypothetical protein
MKVGSKSSRRDPHHRPALPDDPADSPAMIEKIIDVVTSSDTFLPQRVANSFTRAGFGIRRIDREQYHQNVWIVWLKQGSVDLAQDNKVAAKQVRHTLAKFGLKVRSGELTILDRRRDNIKCAFLFGSAPWPPDDV